MTPKPINSEIMSWDPENMDAYWQQCRYFDTRSISARKSSQAQSQKAFNDMLKRIKPTR